MIATSANSSVLNSTSTHVDTRSLRVAVICDFTEENWPSMDLVGNMLQAVLATEHADQIAPTLIRPQMAFASSKTPDKISRLFGRFLHYPRELRRIRDRFDLFHIVDHSYAHLGHYLPAERTVVTCHDVDAFRCLLDSQARRSIFFRGMTRRILSGMQRAAHVTCDTEATRQEILAHGLMPAERMTLVHNGVHPALGPKPNHEADIELSRLLGRIPGPNTDLLHVGSTIARKRIDVLLHTFADLRQHRADLRLLRVGGDFTAPQLDLAQSRGILKHIDVLPRIDEKILAAAYRRSAVLLQTSETEGFGLPVIEAMACGTPVVASDIPPLREVGGAAGIYCPVGDTPQFVSAVLSLLQERDREPSAWQARRDNSIKQAGQFTWSSYAAKMAEIYPRILGQ